MFYIIGNVYRGEGFTWVVNGENYPLDAWKYSKHGEFENEEEAIKESERLNDLYK